MAEIDYASQGMNPKPWPIPTLLAELLLIFLAQSVFLPCLCAAGKAKATAGAAIDVLFVSVCASPGAGQKPIATGSFT